MDGGLLSIRASRGVAALACLVLALALGAVGCGGAAMGRPRYTGAAYPVIVGPRAVEDLLTLPEGYEVIGEVAIACSSRSRTDALMVLDTWGDCDVFQAIKDLKGRASRAGGEALVARRCDSAQDEGTGFDGGPTRSGRMVCKAQVARRSSSMPQRGLRITPSSRQAQGANPDVASTAPAGQY
jgi:hypothetical protein